MSRSYLGIDPGYKGVIAVLTGRATPILHPMPVRETSPGRLEIDTCALFALLRAYLPRCGAVVEHVGTRPAFGAQRSFNFGQGYGAVLAVLDLLHVPTVRIRPQAWKAVMLADTDRSKDAALERVRQLYPRLDLTLPGEKKPRHDTAEALLLARYARDHACENLFELPTRPGPSATPRPAGRGSI